MGIKEAMKERKILLFAAIIAATALVMIVGNTNIRSEEREDMKKELEQSLERVLASVDGAGKVDVFIYLSDDGVKNYEKDIRKNNDTLEEKTVLNGNTPAVVKYSFPSVKGIIITAQGAKNENVRKELEKAAETALGIPTHRICVLTGK